MAYSRNGKSLLGGSRGKQRTGTAEEDPFQLSLIELIQQIPTEGNGAAAAAGAAGMDILYGVVEDQGAAVCQLTSKIQTVPFSDFQ